MTEARKDGRREGSRKVASKARKEGRREGSSKVAPKKGAAARPSRWRLGQRWRRRLRLLMTEARTEGMSFVLLMRQAVAQAKLKAHVASCGVNIGGVNVGLELGLRDGAHPSRCAAAGRRSTLGRGGSA